MGRKVTRTFLTGANPFVLKYDRLMEIAGLVHRYFPGMETIGSFARVTDVTLKTDEELDALHGAGYDGLTIGIETADDEALRFMDKGYLAAFGASNAFQLHGVLPKDKEKLLTFFDDVIKNVGEDELRRYRESVHHL